MASEENHTGSLSASMTALWSNRRGGENPNGRGGPLLADAHPAAPKADKEGRQQAGTAILLRVQIIS